MAFGLQNSVIALTPTGRIDSEFPDGADGSGQKPTWVSGVLPDLSQLEVGTAFSIDLVASGAFVDPGSPNSELGFNFVSGDAALDAGFSFSGTVFSNPCVVVTTGAFRLVAVRNGISVLSDVISFSITSDQPGTDTIAPSIPTNIVASQGSAVGTVALSFDPPCDIAPSGVSASGSAHVDVLINGTVAAPSPIVTPANALAAPSNVNIGSISSPDVPSVNQAGKVWTVSAAGTGIASTASEQCLFVDFGAVSGARKIVARLQPFTSSASTALIGIMMHETAAAGGRFIAIGLRPSNGTVGLYVISRATASATSSQVATQLKDANGQNIVGPVYASILRAADGKTFTVSYSLDQSGLKVITTQTITMGTNVHIGLFCTSQSAGTDAIGLIDEVAITNGTQIVSTVTTSSTVSLQLRSVDTDNNVSDVSVLVQGVPKPPLATGRKKFTGGHWGNFNTSITGTGFTSTAKAEMAAIAPYQNIPGFHSKMEWGALEPISGPTDTSAKYPKGYATGAALIQSIIDYLGSMTPPRKLVIYAGTGYVTSTHPVSTDWSVFPQWLQTDSTFGPTGGAGYKVGTTTTRVNTRFGWWGADVGQGGVVCTFAFSRPAVLARYIQLWQVLGDYFDSDPMIEAIDFAENSFTRGAQQLGSCPDFNLATFYQAEKDFLTAITPHWPTTGVQWQNTFENNGPDTQATMDWMMANNIDWGSTDTYGMAYVNSHGGLPYTQGAQAMCGLLTSGSNNYRDMGRLLGPEIEAPDFGAYLGGGYTAQDILNCANQILHARRLYWVVLTNAASTYGASFKPSGQWGSLGPFLNDPANALTFANVRPSNYG
jgi:hypothetical protein